MRESWTTPAEAAARTTRFVQRQSPLGGGPLRQTLVCGLLGQPPASREALAQTAAALGGEIPPQGRDQRCTPAAATCREPLLRAAIRRVMAADPGAIP
jgi:hypothetical protein